MIKIDNVSAAKIMDKVLYYNINSILYCTNDTFIRDVESFSFWMKNNIFYYHDNAGNHNLINNNNGLRYCGNIAFVLQTLYDDKMICTYNHQYINGFWERNIGLFDVSKMKTVKETHLKNLNFFFTTSNHYLCKNYKDATLLHRISYDFNTIWQFSIKDFPNYINGFYREQEADIKQIIGVYNNLLWVHVGGFRLIGIDVETGKLVHHIENVVKDPRNNFLDTNNGLLKTLSFDYYAEYDLQTLKFKKQVTVQSEKDIKVRESTFYKDDKCMYFCGYHNNNYDKPDTFGIFDTEKAEIIWYDTRKEGAGYFYNPPQANDKILAVLDDKQNLLIYDRE